MAGLPGSLHPSRDPRYAFHRNAAVHTVSGAQQLCLARPRGARSSRAHVSLLLEKVAILSKGLTFAEAHSSCTRAEYTHLPLSSPLSFLLSPLSVT